MCPSGQPQTIKHIVESCRLIRLAGDDLVRLHSDDNEVTWLRDVMDESTHEIAINNTVAPCGGVVQQHSHSRGGDCVHRVVIYGGARGTHSTTIVTISPNLINSVLRISQSRPWTRYDGQSALRTSALAGPLEEYTLFQLFKFVFVCFSVCVCVYYQFLVNKRFIYSIVFTSVCVCVSA